jgi:hypothetical protein
MKTNKRTAVMVGVLFIIGTVSGILSVVFAGAILAAPDYLGKIAANPTAMTLGALFVLIMGVALALIPVIIFPVLKKHNETLALGYIVFRGALETFTYLILVISWLLLVILSQDYVKTGISDAPYFLTIGNLCLKAVEIANTTTTIVFSLGAMMLYLVFYQSKLIPRWLSIWGLVAVTLHLIVSGLVGLFGLTHADTTIKWVLSLPVFVPLLLQEMVMAVWLIVKGFNSPAIEPEPAESVQKELR